MLGRDGAFGCDGSPMLGRDGAVGRDGSTLSTRDGAAGVGRDDVARFGRDGSTPIGFDGAEATAIGPLSDSSTITAGVCGSLVNVRPSVANGVSGPA